jgi:hypothetical protein
MQRLPLVPLAAALPLALVACGNVAPETDTPESVAEALSAPYGGETATDEAPGFGDDAFAMPALRDEDRPIVDPLGDRLDLRDARHLRIAVLWGYPRPHPDATETVDWSGRITAENAGVRVLRTLRFEDSDVVLTPRTDVHVIEFRSHTRPHFDGLLLDVVMAPSLNPDRGPVTLTLDTAPYTGTLTIEPGMRLNRVVTVDDAGHMVAYHVIAPDRDGCAEGFVRGTWTQVGDLGGGRLGVLRGHFTSEDGSARGHLRGVYGVREDGSQVWFAKVINREGRFLGLVAGRYGDGKLAGLYYDSNDAGERIVKGLIRGMYFDGDGDHDGGFFGRYSERCGEDRREGATTDSDEPELALDEAAG